MAVPAQAEPIPVRGRRLVGVRRAFAPVGEARGTTRVMLWLGAVITFGFILVALLAPVIAPYEFDQFRSPEEAPPRTVVLNRQGAVQLGTRGTRQRLG